MTDASARPGESQRRTGFGQDGRAPAIEREGATWHLRSYAAVRQVLRDSTDGIRQGAATDNVLVSRLRPSVIFADGEAHRQQRMAIARFFAPRTVDESYQAIIDSVLDRSFAALENGGRADVSTMSMQLAVEVAARVVGLTDSRRPGMDRRIDRLLAGGDVFADKGSGVRRIVRRGLTNAAGVGRMGQFYALDVAPAIRSRRAQPGEDVISHLLEQGYNPLEILVECLTYATAGMVTTREFIGVAAWHFFDNPELRQAYVAGQRDDRRRILHEILRLEPVASTLWRRTAEPLTLEEDGVVHDIPAGALLVLDLRAANADAAAVGREPLHVHSRRELAKGVRPEVMSFGDGAHRCPGAFLAIHESDLFLHRLLSRPVRMVGEPQLTFNDMLKSYEIRDLTVVVD